MSTFYCRFRSLKVRDLNSVDTRIICAEGLDWQTQASEFRNNIKNNTERILSIISHDYPVIGAYNLVDIPIPEGTNTLLFSNDSNIQSYSTTYRIRFYDQDLVDLRTIIVEVINVRNTFMIIPPIGAKSMCYCINDARWKIHYFDFGPLCNQCEFSSD